MPKSKVRKKGKGKPTQSQRQGKAARQNRRNISFLLEKLLELEKYEEELLNEETDKMEEENTDEQPPSSS